MNKPVIIVSAIVVALLVAGGAFLGGMSLGKAQAQNDQNAQNQFFTSRGVDPNNLPAGGGAQGAAPGAGNFQGAAGQGNFRGQGQGQGQMRGAFGTITKVDGNTVTMTDQQGKTVTVTMSDSTNIMKTVKGSESDLKVGDRIVVQGDRSGDNVAATGIQIPDQSAAGAGGFFGGPGAPGGRRGATASPTPVK